MDLNRAVTFVRVVEAGTFTRAAERLNLPTSSVSRSVAKLEDDLGVLLLERTSRRVALTEAGRAFFERVREAIAGLEEANSLAHDAAKEVQGVVRVAMPVELAANAGSLFASFFAAHPRVRVELTFTNRGGELVGDLVDLAVATGRLPDSQLVARRLGNALSKLYASPAYLARAGSPCELADLAKHDAIAAHAHGGEARWEVLGPHGAEHVDVQARVVGDVASFLSDAAVAGLGVALLSTWEGDRLVREGRLVGVLPHYSAEMPLHVLAHASRHLPRRVALVRDFLIATLGVRCTEHGKLKAP
jgi:DNA-binding transcriptional LysR family regulator